MTIIWHILFRWNIYDADAGAFFGSALRTLGHFEPVLKTFFCVPSLLTGLRQPAFSWHPAHWKVDVQRQSRHFFLCTEPNHAKTKTMEQLSCSNLVKQMYKYYVVPMFLVPEFVYCRSLRWCLSLQKSVFVLNSGAQI